MKLKDESGKIEFDFTGFIKAEHYDTYDNQCAGLKIVDLYAENESHHFFIEVKNYANISDSPVIQAAMNKRQEVDYRMLTHHEAAFPLEIGMTFKDSLLRCLASGKEFVKPIKLLLVINPPPELQARDRERLVTRIRNGYIPSDMHKKAGRYPKIPELFFDMPYIPEINEQYGFGVSVID